MLLINLFVNCLDKTATGRFLNYIRYALLHLKLVVILVKERFFYYNNHGNSYPNSYICILQVESCEFIHLLTKAIRILYSAYKTEEYKIRHKKTAYCFLSIYCWTCQRSYMCDDIDRQVYIVVAIGTLFYDLRRIECYHEKKSMAKNQFHVINFHLSNIT